MRNRTLKLLVLGLLNAAVFHFAYVDFLHAVFGYADFRYEPTSNAYFVWTYLVALLPVFASRESNEPSAVGCALIYALSYVPTQLTLTFMCADKSVDFMMLQALLALSMTVLFRVSCPVRAVAAHAPGNLGVAVFFQPGRLTMTVHVLTLLGLVLLLLEFGSIMKFVSFADVYDLRSNFAEVKSSVLTNYLIMWLTYCFGPFYIARALIEGRRSDWIAGLVILMLVYSATGSKLALLTPVFMCALKYLENGRSEFLLRFLTAVVAFVGLIVLVIPDDGIMRWVNSIFLLRVFGSNGWTAAVYYEYFSSHGYTFYNHIGPINALFAAYPYGERSLGQEIANFYFDSNAANFNAGFWASDGFAALGMAGIPIVTFFLSLFMMKLNDLARHFPQRLINLWLLGFWMALMNVPLTTALLSCGGLLVIWLLWLVAPRAPAEAICA